MIVIDVSLILRKHVNNREGIIRNQEFYIETGEGNAPMIPDSKYPEHSRTEDGVQSDRRWLKP